MVLIVVELDKESVVGKLVLLPVSVVACHIAVAAALLVVLLVLAVHSCEGMGRQEALWRLSDGLDVGNGKDDPSEQQDLAERKDK